MFLSMLVVLISSIGLAGIGATSSCLPVVDIGTSRHRAIENTTRPFFYIFKNIPYAEPPTGDFRFHIPKPKTTVNRTIDDGSNTRICYQATGNNSDYTLPVVREYASACGNISDLAFGSSEGLTQSEDCLLLDVYVPKDIYHHRHMIKRPVLVWIHGGGYTKWSKEAINPVGILERSLSGGREGMVVVTINYRLGVFGFPPRGPGLHAVSSNAGLYDQRLALDWVQDHIHKFGGDPSQTTVIGESAGGGSVLAQLAAFGGVDGSSPFQRAIIQSPAIKPILHVNEYDAVYDYLLESPGFQNAEELRELPASKLQDINEAMVGNASIMNTVFQLNVDGDFVRDVPARLLREGRFDHDVDVIVAHNSREGGLFTDARVEDDEGFRQYFHKLLPGISEENMEILATEMYPEDFSQAHGYTNQTERLMLAAGESVFDCHGFATRLAYNNRTRGYYFDMCPGIHAQDMSYSLFDGEEADMFGVAIDRPTAETMQDWIIDFTVLGDDRGSSVNQLPIYGEGASLLHVDHNIESPAEFQEVADRAAGSRCHFWLHDVLVTEHSE